MVTQKWVHMQCCGGSSLELVLLLGAPRSLCFIEGAVRALSFPSSTVVKFSLIYR